MYLYFALAAIIFGNYFQFLNATVLTKSII